VTLASISEGIEYTVCSYVGSCIGAKNIKQAKRYAQVALMMIVVVSAFLNTMLMIFSKYVGMIYTDDQEVVDYFSECIPFICLAIFLFQIAQVSAGIVTALGYQTILALIYFVADWIIMVPLACILVFVAKIELKGILISIPVSDSII